VVKCIVEEEPGWIDTRSISEFICREKRGILRLLSI